eukprot:6184718-Pleurochrysis_carterae.AAC.6
MDQGRYRARDERGGERESERERARERARESERERERARARGTGGESVREGELPSCSLGRHAHACVCVCSRAACTRSGGEGPQGAPSPNLFMWTLAEKHKALMIALEHRFYGAIRHAYH